MRTLEEILEELKDVAKSIDEITTKIEETIHLPKYMRKGRWS